jgi:DNA polymerase-3 subunit alpha
MSEILVPIHQHTEFSALDGAASVVNIVERLTELGMSACALTDHGTLAGLPAFVQTCRQADITPLVGCEFYLTLGPTDAADPKRVADNYHLTVLAMNQTGYTNLLELTALAQLEGYYYKPRLTLDWLEAHNEGLFVTTGCLASVVNQHILAALRPVGMGEATKRHALRNVTIDTAKHYFEWFATHFPGRFAVEMMDHGYADQHTVAPYLLAFAQEYGVPLILTNDCHFCRKEDAELQELVISISTATSLADMKTKGALSTAEAWMKGSDDLLAMPLFLNQSWAAEAVRNTQWVAGQCAFTVTEPPDLIPAFTMANGDPVDAGPYLWSLVEAGLAKRYGTVTPEILARARYEHAVVCDPRLNFPNYFLVVQEVMQWAREQGIRTGPGRGSAAGSLLAYALGITNADPMRFGLLFERFLNPARVSMPDIDLDFEMERRQEVLAHLSDRYGRGQVAHLATFTRFGAKSAIKDVGRSLGVPLNLTERLGKLFDGTTIAEGRTNKQVSLLIHQETKLVPLLDLAARIEGQMRQVGMHPAGVLIADQPIAPHLPMMRTSKGDGMPMVQYDGETLAHWGKTLKLDVLGLDALGTLKRAEQWMGEGGWLGEGETLQDVLDGPLDDPAVYALLNDNTFGLFQLEQPTSAGVTAEVKPSCFEDIVAINALSRPGALELVPSYVRRKEGLEPADAIHPALQKTLSTTYGLPLYQEDTMNMGVDFAGYSLAEADDLRRAIGKKDAAEMEKHRARFRSGALANGHSIEEADEIFSYIEKFVNYGFNRSHAVVYSLTGYATAYCKAHAPSAYLAALINSKLDDADRVSAILSEVKRCRITLLPPDINASEELTRPIGGAADPPTIRLGLSILRGVGREISATIVREREARPYGSLVDLAMRVPGLKIGVLEALIKSGACDGFGLHRAGMMAIAKDCLTFARSLRAKSHQQRTLFAVAPDDGALVARATATLAWGMDERLAGEYEVVGSYLSASPVALAQQCHPTATSFALLHPLADGERGSLGVFVVEVRSVDERKTKRGDPMMVVGVADGDGTRRDVTFFSDALETCRPLLVPGAILLLAATPQCYRGRQGMMGGSVQRVTFAQTPEQRSLTVTLSPRGLDCVQAVRLAIEWHDLLGDEPLSIVRPDGTPVRPAWGVSDPMRAYSVLHAQYGESISLAPAHE